MSHFCFQASQTQRLEKLALQVGEEAPPILWKGVGPDDNVHAVFFLQEPVVVFADEKAGAHAPQNSYRVLELTGRAPGTGKFRAVEVPRTGDLRTLGELQVNVREVEGGDADLIYSGKLLFWHSSIPKAVRPAGPLLFSATSGLLGSQIGLQQSVKDHGPVPEGLYTFFTHVNPRQNSVQAANLRGDGAISNTEEGIEFLPIGGNGPVRPEWGTFRVRLTPVRGNMHGRGGFYLHNSRKGFSHGCIEVGKTADGDDFFAFLLAYSGEKTRRPKLTLRVKYSYPEQLTRGSTAAP
ncbi:hypothetical protein ACL02O_34000 [Micromonospora sp. MS34]|uniref:hypothetical protein n=1 Tax=Micromonospora sp. MS34 TaxID=3385971 RepID=UPI0039A10660